MSRNLLLFLILLPITSSGVAWSQVPFLKLEIAEIRFRGNDEMNTDVLQAVIQSRETPGAFWKFLGKISSTLGDEPRYYDPGILEADLLRLRQFYRDRGFFLATVDTSLHVDVAEKEIEIAFVIREGKRSLIDTLTIHGFEGLPSILLEDLTEKRLVEVGDPYSTEVVEGELRRMIGSFANNGYVRVRVDEPIARRYASTNNVTLVWSFHPNERYSFGSITVTNDSTVSERVEESIVLRHLDFAPGDFYSEERKTGSERNLNRLGVFEATRIEPQVESTPGDSLFIPMRVFVRPRAFHELTPEIGVNDENSAFNLLTGIGYSNRNFFGGARNFSARLRVSLQSIQDVNLSRVIRETGFEDSTLISRIELSGKVVQPYVFSNKVSLSATLSATLEKQKYYFAPIYQARLGLNAEIDRFSKGSFEVNLERVDPRSFTEEGRAALQQREGLTPQLNAILTITLQRDTRNDLFSPSAGSFYSASVEESGSIAATFGGLLGSRLPYSSYIKFAGVAQGYWDPGGDRRFIWAGRVRGGAARVYRDTIQVPITRRFFAGGSESVRGWKSRELDADLSANLGGNALFEANLEGRWNLFQDAGRFLFIDLSNISIVGFFDMGNVWNEMKWMRLSEIAMAGGIGFRWDTIAGPIRIDLGVRVYDPFDTSGRKWISQRRVFHDAYGLIHFGIGHAF
ncbi:MAG: BamA/TamA family outer membrane protein [Bacteroidota bacterium]